MTDEIEQDFLEAEKATQDILEENEAPFSGKSRFLGQKIEGKLHGPLEQYDENSNLLSRQNFEKGQLHGESHLSCISIHLVKLQPP